MFLIEQFQRGIRPPTDLSVPDWASKNVKIANSERASKFDIKQTPWLREPMECAGDIETREVVFLSPTGSGKSTMAEGLIPYVVSEDPGPFLYASQTDSDSKFWVESRLMPALKSCPKIKQLWPKNRHKVRATEILFPHMPFISGGANMSNFQEKSMRYLYGDEVWTWKKGMLGFFLKRHHDRWNRKVILVSQAGYEGDDLDLEYNKTDKAEYSFMCPECSEYVAYSRKVLKYDLIKTGIGTVDKQATADTARLCCPHCKAEFADKPHILRMLSNSGKYISTSENGLRNYRGFRMHRFAVWWIPLGRYVVKLLEANEQLEMGYIEPVRQLYQADDCQPWKDTLSAGNKQVSRNQANIEKRDPKDLIEGETHRFFTLDVGKNHYWGVIRAWSKTAKKSELLWYGQIGDNEGQTKIKELVSLYDIKPGHVLIDVGYEAARIKEICGMNRWRGIRGNGQVKAFNRVVGSGKNSKRMELLYTSNQQMAVKNIKVIFFEIATNPIKDMLYRLQNGGSSIEWTIPSDVDKQYLQHMRSEVRREGPVGKNKEIRSHWETVSRQNHLWDCEVYQVAAALVSGVFDS